MFVSRVNIPNLITTFRIVGSIGLLFMRPFSMPFFVLYTLCGISDVLDGFLARYLHVSSETGARLDSIADLLFYSVMLIYVIPYLWFRLPYWFWGIVALVLGIRISAYGVAAVKYHCFASLHTYANKLTGLAVFLFPYLLIWVRTGLVCGGVCLISGISSLEELLIHLYSTSYNPRVQSLFQKNK